MANPNSAAQRSFAAEPYDSVAAVLASKQITSDLVGQRIHVKGGLAYDVLPDSAAVWDQETEGGAKLVLVTDLGEVTAAALPNLSEAVKVSRSKNLNIKVTGTFSASAIQLRDESIYGPAQITATSGSASALKLGVRSQQWKYKRLTDLNIDGSGKTSKGIVFDNGGADNHLSGRWILSGGRVQASSIGIEKPSGNIGNAFYEVNVTGNDIGYKATDAVGSVMHPGCDRFFGGHWSYNAIAAAYINGNTVGTGQHVFSGTIFEANPGFGIYVNNYRTGYTPLALLDVWFEGNATAASVSIDGVAKPPKDVFMRNTAAAVIERSTVRKFQFEAAHVLINASYWDDASIIEADSASVVRATNAFMDGYRGGQVIESLLRANRVAGNFAAAHGAPVRSRTVKKPSHGEAKLALSYDGSTAYTLTGSSTLTSTQESDGGELRDYAAQFSQPVAGTHLTSVVTLPEGKWFVYTLDWKQISGTPQSVGFVDGGTLAAFPVSALAGGKWRTMGGVARTSAETSVRFRITNSTSATEANVFRVRNVQIVQFDTEAEAIAYYNSHAVIA